MKHLKQLVNVISSYSQVTTQNNFGKGKLNQLYKGIVSGKISDDEAAVNMLYGKDKNARAKYSKQKYYLRKRLLNSILLINLDSEVEQRNERRRAFFRCFKAWMTSYFLILLNARDVGIHHLEQSMPDMIKYDFTLFTLESAKMLRQHYAVIKGDLHKARSFDDLIQVQLQNYIMETKVDGLYQFLINNFTLQKANKEYIHHLAHQYYNDIKYQLPQQASSSLTFKSRMIEIIKHMTALDYEKGAAICKEVIELLLAKPFVDRIAVITIYYQWIECCVGLQQFELGQQQIAKALYYTNAGSFNWFKGMKIQVQLFLIQKKYTEAFEVYERAMLYEGTLKKNTILLDEWKILELVLHFLIKAQKIELQENQFVNQTRASTIINNIFMLNKDKEGMNIPIVLFQVAIWITDGKYDQVIDQINAIKKYSHRYLNTEEHKRTVKFIKMLDQMVKSGFQCRAIKAWEADQLAALRKFPFSFSTFHIEIMPYENLWELLVTQLK